MRKVYNKQSTVVRSGVNIELFHSASDQEFRRKYGLEDNFVLLQVGYLASIKRQCDSIIALYYLSKKYDDLKLILDGAGTQKLIELSKRLGVEDKVMIQHTTNDVELAKVYAACDVFLFPPARALDNRMLFGFAPAQH